MRFREAREAKLPGLTFTELREQKKEDLASALRKGSTLLPHPAYLSCASQFIAAWRLTPSLSKRSIASCPCPTTLPTLRSLLWLGRLDRVFARTF
jgi:hypothetical protein